MSHIIRIEGSSTAVDAEPGDTVLDALLMAGVGFSYSCQAGNCGTCRCELVSGDILELEYSEHALSAEDRARGVVLACRAQVWGDVTVRRLDDEEFVVHPSRILDCRVTAVEKATHDIWRVRLDIRTGGPYAFSAGQYASVEFPFARGKARDYSMANAPFEPGIEFHVREMSGGAVSSGLGEKLAVGDAVRVSGPFGSAHLREKHFGPVIAVAGGSGLAPIRAILVALDQLLDERPVYVYVGARTEADVYCEDEIRGLARLHPDWHVHWVLSHGEPDPGRARRTGLVTDAIAQDFASFEAFKAYVAGPPAMVEAASELLQARGLPLRDLHADAFYPADRKASAPSEEVSIP